MDESTEVDTCSTDSNHVEKLEIGQEEKIVKCATDPRVPRQHSLNSESGEFLRCFFNIVVYCIDIQKMFFDLPFQTNEYLCTEIFDFYYLSFTSTLDSIKYTKFHTSES